MTRRPPRRSRSDAHVAHGLGAMVSPTGPHRGQVDGLAGVASHRWWRAGLFASVRLRDAWFASANDVVATGVRDVRGVVLVGRSVTGD